VSRLATALAAAVVSAASLAACGGGTSLQSLIETHVRASANAHCVGKPSVPTDCQGRVVTVRCTRDGHYRVQAHYPTYRIFKCVVDVARQGSTGQVHERSTYTAYSAPDPDLGPLGDFHLDPPLPDR